MDKKVVDLAREVAKVELPAYRSHLDVVVACEDDEDNDIDIPQVSIYFGLRIRLQIFVDEIVRIHFQIHPSGSPGGSDSFQY
ncbi:Ubiquitin-activating enzyme E1 1 [Vitis vinifera]|uniref:Ubiquitin-activating enzyme E1 1 n=1 Tax=Vitis vinifera TaxID=29760 RepID=A0A438G0I2_VITVI|nr:Ubiquitin-activating enzyme E1 1 [Vitis vinifera]